MTVHFCSLLLVCHQCEFLEGGVHRTPWGEENRNGKLSESMYSSSYSLKMVFRPSVLFKTQMDLDGSTTGCGKIIFILFEKIAAIFAI